VQVRSSNGFLALYFLPFFTAILKNYFVVLVLLLLLLYAVLVAVDLRNKRLVCKTRQAGNASQMMVGLVEKVQQKGGTESASGQRHSPDSTH